MDWLPECIKRWVYHYRVQWLSAHYPPDTNPYRRVVWAIINGVSRSLTYWETRRFCRALNEYERECLERQDRYRAMGIDVRKVVEDGLRARMIKEQEDRER